MDGGLKSQIDEYSACWSLSVDGIRSRELTTCHGRFRGNRREWTRPVLLRASLAEQLPSAARAPVAQGGACVDQVRRTCLAHLEMAFIQGSCSVGGGEHLPPLPLVLCSSARPRDSAVKGGSLVSSFLTRRTSLPNSPTVRTVVLHPCLTPPLMLVSLCFSLSSRLIFLTLPYCPAPFL